MMRNILIQLLVLALASASPIAPRQAVTEAISPSEPPPSGCAPFFDGIFGIAVLNLTTSQTTLDKRKEYVRRADCDKNHATKTSRRCTCEDEVAPTSIEPPPPMTIAQVNQIGDGQIQGSLHTVTMNPINQISDGQIQNQRVAYGPTAYTPPSQTIQPATANASNPVLSAAPTPKDASARSGTAPLPTATAATAADTIVDPALASNNSASTDFDMDMDMVSCRTPSSLQLHLSDGILTDALGRTGYIASNYQFQFDSPPQSEALYTAGWAVCGHNGSLSLGGSAVFWQCLSGDFYNLYDRHWASQCSPVSLRVVGLVDCAS